MITIDSDIWIYYLDATLPEHGKVKSTLEAAIRTEGRLTSTILWMEAARYLFRVSSLPRAEMCDRIKRLFRISTMKAAGFDMDTLNTSIGALEDKYKHRIGGKDAAILATMKRTRPCWTKEGEKD